MISTSYMLVPKANKILCGSEKKKPMHIAHVYFDTLVSHHQSLLK